MTYMTAGTNLDDVFLSSNWRVTTGGNDEPAYLWGSVNPAFTTWDTDTSSGIDNWGFFINEPIDKPVRVVYERKKQSREKREACPVEANKLNTLFGSEGDDDK